MEPNNRRLTVTDVINFIRRIRWANILASFAYMSYCVWILAANPNLFTCALSLALGWVLMEFLDRTPTP